MYRNLLHFHTPIMKQQKEKSRSQFHLQLHQKLLRYLGIGLTKEVKDLYSEKYRTLMKEIEEDTENGKTFHAHGLEEQILLKCLYNPKQLTHSMQSLPK